MKDLIRKILKEEAHIPIAIRRRASIEDIEEAFESALERMGDSMENPDSVIYKEKGTTLKLFARFVIDEMITYLEQDYFTDDNRIYFDDDDYYYNEIRQPLMDYYGDRIKQKYDEIVKINLKENKEDLQGQEFIDNHYKELERFEKSKDTIIDYIKSQYENLYDVDFKTKKVKLASMKLGMEKPTVDVVVVTLKFIDLKDKEVISSSPIKKDILNIFKNYFGFDTLAYGAPIALEFKAQAWVTF